MTSAVSNGDLLVPTRDAALVSKKGSIRPQVSTVVLSLWLLLFATELVASVVLCDGRLVFTLDDPYIHLAVADHILSGGYGINAAEFSSPSSSVIWPYLLALTEAVHLGTFGPLLINAFAACATVITVLRLLDAVGLVNPERDGLFPYIVALLAVFAASAVALPMTGMEHSLHIWATVVTFAGLVSAARGQAPSWLHFAALVLLPLIRFEGAAFALAAIVGFAFLGHQRFAATALAVIACGLSVYAALMVSRGLPLMPSSVLLKSRIVETAYERTSALGAILDNLTRSLANPYGQRLLMCGFIVACSAIWARANHKALIVCMVVLAAIGAHLVFGQYDWFHRYEVYILTLAILAVLYVAAELRSRLAAREWMMAKSAIILLLAYAATPYLSAAMVTPFAARNIYEQQYQMGRFAREIYNRPVAVNDLGLVAYKNTNFVLDLWGLGSEQVRKAKLSGHYGPDQMTAFAEQYHVGVVMIYDSWFADVPANWTKVAILHTHRVTAADADVAFYRTPSAEASDVTKALDALTATLPARDSLERLLP